MSASGPSDASVQAAKMVRKRERARCKFYPGCNWCGHAYDASTEEILTAAYAIDEPRIRAEARAEADATLRDENVRLRALYENVTRNRERFGWTINHLLECEEALRCSQEEAAEVRAEMLAEILPLVKRAQSEAGVCTCDGFPCYHGTLDAIAAKFGEA